MYLKRLREPFRGVDWRPLEREVCSLYNTEGRGRSARASKFIEFHKKNSYLENLNLDYFLEKYKNKPIKNIKNYEKLKNKYKLSRLYNPKNKNEIRII